MKDDARADAELLAATAHGDDVAFAVLVRRYIRSATLLSVQLLGDRDDADHAGRASTERAFEWLIGAKTGALPNVGSVGTQLVLDAAAAIVLLLVTTTLSVYKPWGKASYGRRGEDERMSTSRVLAAPAPLPRGLRIFLAIVGVIVAVILVVHLAGGGPHHHTR